MNDKLKFYRSTLVQMTKEAYKKLPNEMKVEEAVNYGDLLTKAIMKQCDEFADECFGETSNCCDPKFYITVDPRYNVTTTEEPIRTIVDHGPQYQDKEDLDYVCKLTQWDIDDLKTRLNRVYNTCKLIHEDKKHADNVSFKAMAANIEDVIDYFDNVNNVRTKSQGLQKARNNQKSYGTLGEHWYELMRLFEIKDFYCLNWKNYFNEVIEIIKENKEDKVRFNSSAKNTYYIVIKVIADSLGIEFIEDFVKACEKCEE